MRQNAPTISGFPEKSITGMTGNDKKRDEPWRVLALAWCVLLEKADSERFFASVDRRDFELWNRDTTK
jgi:hypothetical protein